MRRACFISLLVLLCACRQSAGPDRNTKKLLDELDGYVQAREMYMVRKKDRMSAMTKLLEQTNDPERRFDLEMNIADEYFSFSFDSTQTYYKHCMQLAEADPVRSNDVKLRLGHLYAKAGNYMEAYNLFYGQIDTATLTDAQKADYLLYLYDFSRDLGGNSGLVDRFSVPSDRPYRDSLLKILPVDSEAWRSLLRDKFLDGQNLAAADSIARILLSDLRQEDRSFAIHAYYRSEIADRSGSSGESLLWLVKSAESDIINAVKDYASLTVVAQRILSSDVERSFRYLRIAQEDALMYNAKLRPWQISRSLMDVENAYSARREKSKEMTKSILILLIILAVALSLITWYSLNRTVKLTKLRRELENAYTRLEVANITLNDLNLRISKADRVKEDFILRFLEDLSDEISIFRSEDNRYRNLLKQGKSNELLKELAFSGRSEKAKDRFYEAFDETFLGMYPDFVEQFNSLLRQDARLSPPKGRLNTELRIFALIRLGVDDSKKIASMLDYSLSTIYNYKVAVKNSALEDRDGFEQRVKNLGK
ncbi:MAG: hypothetical protein IKH11_05915 [Bacteroidales bacterium]|nr:hypothetical protein [Bacteroidales bacterium]